MIPVKAMLACTMAVGLTGIPVLAASTSPDWVVQKSKTATPLDSDNNTVVTLSLPAAEKVKNTVDVVFVMDHSGGQDITDLNTAASTMLNDLKAQSGLDVNIGVIKFDAWGIDAIKAASNGASSNMIPMNDANNTLILDALTGDYSILLGGSNTEQPIRMGNAMLATDKDPYAQKFLIVLSDFLTYVYEGSAATGGAVYDNIPVGSTRTGNTQSSLYDYTSYTDYQSWAKLKAAFYNNNKTIPGSDWQQDAMFFRSGSSMNYYSQKDWMLYDYSGEYDTQPANKWVLQDIAAYSANADAISTSLQSQETAGTIHHITGHMRSMLLTYDAMHQAIANGTRVVAYRNLDPNFSLYNVHYDMLEDIRKDGAFVFQDGKSVENVFNSVTSSIVYLIQKGTITDKIGKDFDLVSSTNPFNLNLAGIDLPWKATGTNEWSFGTPDINGVYPYVVTYTPGSSEQLVWKINVPVKNSEKLKLSYKLHLNAAETGTYNTNESALLDSYDSEGNAHYNDAFPVPNVKYTKPAPQASEPSSTVDPSQATTPLPEAGEVQETTPSTSDQSHVMLYFLLLAAAAAAAGGILVLKHSK